MFVKQVKQVFVQQNYKLCSSHFPKKYSTLEYVMHGKMHFLRWQRQKNSKFSGFKPLSCVKIMKCNTFTLLTFPTSVAMWHLPILFPNVLIIYIRMSRLYILSRNFRFKQIFSNHQNKTLFNFELDNVNWENWSIFGWSMINALIAVKIKLELMLLYL